MLTNIVIFYESTFHKERILQKDFIKPNILYLSVNYF